MTTIEATNTPAIEIDRDRAEAFGERIVTLLNEGSLALLLSIGHRTGLLDTLAGLPPSTSEEVANATGLDERYVREWLSGLTTAQVVEYDPAAKTFRLPPEHAASLVRAAGSDNLAVFTQYISLMGGFEDRIISHFENGGGIPYEEYAGFQPVMAEDSGQAVLPALIDQILPLVPGIKGRLEAGIDVLDLGFGSGKALNLLARTYPASRFTGWEISDEGIAIATAEARAAGLTNVVFEKHDGSQPRAGRRFDFITTFDAIHDQRDPQAVLDNIHSWLREGGHYLMVDITSSRHLENNIEHVLGTTLYTISLYHCMTVSLAYDGEGLGTMWGRETALEMLAEAGFGETNVSELPHDPQNSYYVSAK